MSNEQIDQILEQKETVVEQKAVEPAVEPAVTEMATPLNILSPVDPNVKDEFDAVENAKEPEKIPEKEKEIVAETETKETTKAVKEQEKIDKQMLKLKKENFELKINELVKSGAITPVVGKQLKDNVEQMILDGQDKGLQNTINILKDNKGVEMLQRSNTQYIPLVDNVQTEKVKSFLDSMDRMNKERQNLLKK